MWAWCSGGCSRWYYLNDEGEPACPVCLSLPTAYTAEDPCSNAEPSEPAGEVLQASGQCPSCDHWFLVQDPALDTHYLCPVCLVPAAQVRWGAPAGPRAGDAA